MFSTFLRAQARLAVPTRTAFPLRRVLSSTVPRRTLLSQLSTRRTFSSGFSDATSGTHTQARYDDGPEQFQDESGPRNILFISNLPFSVEEAELREMFSPYGAIRNIRIATSPNGRQRGFAHVTFEKVESAAAAKESAAEEPFVLLDRALRIEYSNRQRTTLNNPSETLHVANYPFPGDDRPLRRAFADFTDHILRVTFMRDIRGSDTAKVFVQFTDVNTATRALEQLQEIDVGGTNLQIYYANQRRFTPGRPQRQNQMFDA